MKQCCLSILLLFHGLILHAVSPESMERAQEELDFMVKDVWAGQGCVVVGRVIAEGNPPIVTRAALSETGEFAVALYPKRSLSFYAHGYQPLTFTPRSYKGIVDVGQLEMVPLAEDSKTSIQLRVETVDGKPLKNVVAKLRLRLPPPIWDDWGYEGSCTLGIVHARKRFKAPAQIQFSDLSPVKYQIELSKKGFRTEQVEFVAGEADQLPLVTLMPSKRVQFASVASIEGSLPASWQAKITTLEVDGQHSFLFSDEEDELGNDFDLRLKPTTAGIRASFWYSSSEFYDLGRFNSFPEAADLDLSALKKAATKEPSIRLLEGHLYFFECADKKTSCLFYVKMIE